MSKRQWHVPDAEKEQRKGWTPVTYVKEKKNDRWHPSKDRREKTWYS